MFNVFKLKINDLNIIKSYFKPINVIVLKTILVQKMIVLLFFLN